MSEKLSLMECKRSIVKCHKINFRGGTVGTVIGEEGIKSFSGSVSRAFSENLNGKIQGLL